MLSKAKALVSDSSLPGPFRRLFPTSTSVTLFVVEGPNAGTVQKLMPAAYRIGSALDSDIVLADEALAPVHALLDIGRSRVRVEPLAGAVTVPGRAGTTEPGGALTLPLPAELTLGSSRIVLRSPVEATVGGSRLRAVTLTAALLVILGGLSGIALSSGGSGGGSEVRMSEQATTPETGKPAVQTAALAPVVPRQQTPQEALQSRIDAAHLDSVTLSAQGSRIVATGRLSPEEMAQWREIQAWFDRTFASSALLASEVATGAGSNAPEIVIQAVWTGDNPYLITHTGSKYFEGADLGGGWSVDKIRSDAVTLRSRSGQSFVMVLTDPAKP